MATSAPVGDTTTAPDVTPTDPAPTTKGGAGATVGFLVGFAPWILYWILTGAVSFRVAISVALAVSVLSNLASLARHRTPKILELGTTIAFLGLAIVGFATNDVFIGRWIQPIGNAAFLAIMVVSVLIKKPFTLQYAEESTPPELWGTPGFFYVNQLITYVWIAVTAFMTVLALIPPFVQGDATMDDGGSALSIVCYWILPYTAMAGAILFTTRFPDWFGAEFEDPPPPTNTAPATLPGAPDRVQAGKAVLHDGAPSTSLDEPLEVVVSGLDAGAEVVVQASTVDVLGNLWSSSTTFHADDDGTLDTTTSSATAGGYAGVDPGGLVWSMTFSTEGRPPDIYVPSPAANAVALAVEVPGATLTRTVVRRGLPDGASVREVHADGVVGRLVLPPGDGPFAGVVLLGGSEGGVDSQFSNAAVLASHGFASLSLGYFGLDGLPAQLVQIPLESIAGGIGWLAAQPEVAADRVAAMAISRGSEGLLATASLVADLPLRSIIAVSPASVSWGALGDDGTLPDTPSWTVGGQPVPFVAMSDATLMRGAGRDALRRRGRTNPHDPHLMHLHDAYAAVLGTPAAAAAAIPVDRIAVPILCLSADDDQVWPSGTMAGAIAERRRAAGTPAAAGDEHHHYAGAGHLIRLGLLATTVSSSSGIAFGGTPAGLAAAQADATARILAFLARTTGA